jgi:hypothetical protein
MPIGNAHLLWSLPLSLGAIAPEAIAARRRYCACKQEPLVRPAASTKAARSHGLPYRVFPLSRRPALWWWPGTSPPTTPGGGLSGTAPGLCRPRHQDLRRPLPDPRNGVQLRDDRADRLRPPGDLGADLLDALIREVEVVEVLRHQEALVRPEPAHQGPLKLGSRLRARG